MPVNEEDRKHKNHHNLHEQSMIHVHTYMTETDVADDHQHVIMGVSGPARERGETHVHRVHGRTSFISEEGECGHWHMYDVMTGPAIEIAECSHVHYFSGVTTEDDDHCHTFSGVTGLGPSELMEDEEDMECEEDEYEDECKDPCDEMPVKNMPKYKYKYGKRPDQE